MIDYKFFDSIQEVVIVIDQEGKTVFGNLAAGILFDVSARRFASRKDFNTFAAFTPNPLAIDLLSLHEPSQMREVKFTIPGGKEGSVQIIVQPQPAFFSVDPVEASRFIVTIRDVSLEKVLQKKYRGELDQKESVIEDLKAARSKLEDYSHNLEKMVADRTAEITKTNALLRTILDSLGQGILVFGDDGKTLPIYSQVCRSLFGDDLAGRPIESVLGFKDGEGDAFANWRQAVFAEMLEFSDLTPLAPSRLPLAPPTEIALSYNRMLNEAGVTAGVVVVTTDRTAEVEAIRVANKERALVKKIVQVAKHRDAFRLFVEDAQELIGQFLKGEVQDQAVLERKLHTLKGGAATFALETLAHCCHVFEDFLKSMGPGDLHSASFKMRLMRSANEMKTILDDELQTLVDLLGPLQKAKAVLRIEEVLKVYSMSMVELADRLGKQLAPLKIEGGTLEVPTVRFQSLLNSFVHAFRNAIDHGLETPDKRLAQGKTAEGHLTITCSRENARLKIVIQDDGAGVNVTRIREKLRSNPLRAMLANGTDYEVAQAILEGDLSTADIVTDISGRGVGLSAVTDEVRKLGGTIRVDSTQGQGMSITLDVPFADEAKQAA
jgi:two-component system chemotaxis sensor kinase CheA